MKAETFIKEILVGDLQAEHVAVGEDFRFGYERKGSPELTGGQWEGSLAFPWTSFQKKWMAAERSAVPSSARS